MKIIRISAGYYHSEASNAHIHVRIDVTNDEDEKALMQKFHAAFLENREKFIDWWGAKTIYKLDTTLKTTVKQLNEEGEDIEIIKPEDGYWTFELRE